MKDRTQEELTFSIDMRFIARYYRIGLDENLDHYCDNAQFVISPTLNSYRIGAAEGITQITKTYDVVYRIWDPIIGYCTEAKPYEDLLTIDPDISQGYFYG